MHTEKTNSPLLEPSIIEAKNSGFLSGYSFCAKDNFDIRGFKTGAGSPVYRNTVQAAISNAACVELLLNSGANLIGKTKMCEFAYGALGTGNPYGDPVNPRAQNCIVGGSSSGSASAVASGLSDFALGTDTACSVRLPASVCGIFGIRPTHKAVSMDGVMPLSGSLDTVGWFTREAKLLKLIGRVLLPPSTFDSAPEDIHLLVAKDAIELLPLGAQIEFKRIASMLSTLFKSSSEIMIGNDNEQQTLNWYWFHVWRVEVKEAWDNYATIINEIDLQAKNFNHTTLEYGTKQTTQETIEYKNTFNEIGDSIRAKICEGNVLCLPTSISEAPALNASDETLVNFARTSCCLLSVAGLSGLPQITLPIGSIAGKPFGISLIGWKGSDHMLLNFAEQITSDSRLDKQA